MERRRYGHVSFFAKLTIRSACGQTTCGGSCVNISRGGIGLFSERFFAPGERVQLVMDLRSGGQTVKVTVAARVVWAKAEADGTMLGAEFESPVTPASQPVLCEHLDKC